MSEVRVVDEPSLEPTPGLWAWAASRPWWVQVLAVYGAARLFTTAVFLWVAGLQEQNPWTPADPDYFPYVGFMFDGSWYRTVAENGYPAQLPIGADGLVQQNAWAFFPLFPMLARGLMRLTGGPWEVVAPLLAVVLGAGAMLAIHRTVVRGAPRAVAARPGLPLATVALVSVFPTAAVLQVAYTEALALLLVAGALLLLLRRDYAWMALVVVALGFTRAVALPMAVVVVVHAAVRWWSARRGTGTWTWRTGTGLGALAVLSAVSGLLWPAICGWVTGVPDGYLQTQEAWRGVREVAPFGGWTYVPQFWFGQYALPVVALSFALVIAVLVVPAAWRLGRELHAWAAAYIVYIAAVVEPGSSLARFLLLAYPLGAVTAGVVTRPAAARRWWFGAVLVLMLGLQVLWVRQMWHANPVADWPP
ncbi:hypothetical protein [Cellulomonas fengjieae]|uniref:Glycosyltransferase RgtA/B/C/D-like domain-containing protein n=1 Tax=Cellulomonas fengjieae TaxID=2819978 RepID=A0ABS3SL27_9CELL|nr:hypothetical protein [Cellulomonas fengjieae]MBO3086445.1 hypothetical protein [Cellulomonas fengjieae]MBO3100440.1 hypothetical protein [Cellulomonas fengjieae]QVI66691.1 hypothetical protein KG102_03570 [Cellulomonas fengjieae]